MKREVRFHSQPSRCRQEISATIQKPLGTPHVGQKCRATTCKEHEGGTHNKGIFSTASPCPPTSASNIPLHAKIDRSPLSHFMCWETSCLQMEKAENFDRVSDSVVPPHPTPDEQLHVTSDPPFIFCREGPGPATIPAAQWAWRKGRVYCDVCEETKETGKKQQAIAMGLEALREGMEAQVAQAFLWAGVINTQKMMLLPLREKMDYVYKIRDLFQKATDLDPELGMAHFAMGEVELLFLPPPPLSPAVFALAAHIYSPPSPCAFVSPPALSLFQWSHPTSRSPAPGPLCPPPSAYPPPQLPFSPTMCLCSALVCLCASAPERYEGKGPL